MTEAEDESLERTLVSAYGCVVTIGFATTYLENERAAFLIAADSRYSATEQTGDTADMAIKTYALGQQTGAVASGNALSVATAADLVRGIADHHDRISQNLPINFYSTIRLFSFFLDRVECANPWSKGCEVVLAGFLANGSPAVAKIITRPNARTEVHCMAPKQRGSLILMVGQQDAKEQIASTISRAFVEGHQHWAERAAGTIWYLCRHEGTPVIGGAPSVAVCARGENLYWPFVVIEGRTFLRGFDVSDSMPGVIAHDPLHLEYDESWHSETDQRRDNVGIRSDEGFLSLSRCVDDWVKPHELFTWKVDPDALTPPPDLGLPPAVVVIFRPGEVSYLPPAGA
jgi:hypothetical protein